MKLDEMYLDMQKRYDADVEQEQKMQEEAKKKAEEKNRKLKELIENLIRDVRHELETNMQAEIYEGYKASRKAGSRCKSYHTKLKCYLHKNGFVLNVVVNGHNSKDIEHAFGFTTMNQFVDYMAEHFEVKDEEYQYILEYSLDENDVTFYWNIGRDIYGFKATLKNIFSRNSIHRYNGVDLLQLKLN